MALELVKADLEPSLKSAIDDLKARRLQSAAGNERAARNAMLDIARILAPKRDREEIIRQAIADIEKAIEDQTKVKKETEQIKQKENRKD